MRRKTNEQFIDEVTSIHGDKYDYSKVQYTRSADKVIIICKQHGEFRMTPTNLLRGSGCVKCGKLKWLDSYMKTINSDKDWNFEQPEEYKLIPLTQGKFSKVDNDDFDRLKDINWSINSRNYAVNLKLGFLHKNIVSYEDGFYIDHINNDSLDNRKTNLRVCTHQENCMNRTYKKTNKTSKYKGVHWREDIKKWVAQICYNYKVIYIGSFSTEYEACLSYNEKAKELFGEFSRLNKI